MERMIELGRRVVAQTKQRVFKGVANRGREDRRRLRARHEDLLGQSSQAHESGHVVKVQEAEGGIVMDIAVVTEGDRAVACAWRAPIIAPFGCLPRVVATGRGFFSNDNVCDVEALGVAWAAIPKPGYRSPAWLEREPRRPFRRARAWRAGGEARIAQRRVEELSGDRRTHLSKIGVPPQMSSGAATRDKGFATPFATFRSALIR